MHPDHTDRPGQVTPISRIQTASGPRRGLFLRPGVPSAPACAQCGAFPAPDTSHCRPSPMGAVCAQLPASARGCFCARACPLPRRAPSEVTFSHQTPPLPAAPPWAQPAHSSRPSPGLFLRPRPGGFCPAVPLARRRASLWAEIVPVSGTDCPAGGLFFRGGGIGW